MNSLFLILLCLIASFSCSIDHCQEEDNNVCKACDLGYILSQNTCLECSDASCLRCFSTLNSSCMECALGFTITNFKCGKLCTNMYQCKYCNGDLTQCLSCRNGCSLSNGQCSCSSRIAIIVVCVVISVIIVALVVYCLTKTSSSRKNKVIQFALNANTNQLEIIRNLEKPAIILDSNENDTKKITSEKEIQGNQPRQLTILSTGSQSVTKTQNDDKTMCDYCLVEGSIEKLSCGCHLCSRHHALMRNEKGNNKCPVCHKDVYQIEMLRCPFCNNRSNSNFKAIKCSCGLQVCLTCFEESQSNWRKCPNCI